MLDAFTAIPAAVLRSLADMLYEKQTLLLSVVIKLLVHEFTYSSQANRRKGGLIGLAAATVGLSSEASQHLEVVIVSVI
ncbi:putative vacuole morphology and inheritance protein [Helianthus anomalus]